MKDLTAQSNEALKYLKQLNLHLEQETNFLPKQTGLNLIESAPEVSLKTYRFVKYIVEK